MPAQCRLPSSPNRRADHFADVNKMVELDSGSQREIEVIILTCYACYLTAQNGDTRKYLFAFTI